MAEFRLLNNNTNIDIDFFEIICALFTSMLTLNNDESDKFF